MKTKHALILIVLLTLFSSVVTTFAQGTAFTYQGQLTDGGNLANGLYDFRLSMMESPDLGVPLDQRITNGVPVSNGFFTVTLDFGAELFDGSPRWLEIEVKSNNVAGPYTLLSPRQELTAAPYAILAGSISGPLPSASLSGTYNNPVTLENEANLFGGAFTGNGGELTNVNAGTLEGLSAAGFWRVSGNADTSPGSHFLGTVDNQALELRVNNTRALRLQPTSGAPNVIGGAEDNVVAEGVTGATIGGGSHNSAAAVGDKVGGGSCNQAVGGYSVVGGGEANTASGYHAVVSGGWQSKATNAYATVAGGAWNIAGGPGAFVGGGGYDGTAVGGNVAAGAAATVGGGVGNLVSGDFGTIAGGGLLDPEDSTSGNIVYDPYGTIGGGGFNRVGTDDGSANCAGATVGGGNANQATAVVATVGGGVANEASGFAATIGGGYANLAAGSYATVAGGGPTDRYDWVNTRNGVYDDFGTIGGGGGNHAGSDDGDPVSAKFATVGGGLENQATGPGSVIGGGGFDGMNPLGNTASGAGSTIGGGGNNTASGAFGSIGGGFGNEVGHEATTVGGGHYNEATGHFSTIPGGRENTADGGYSFAAGRRAKALHDGAFVWADSRDLDYFSTTTNEFSIRAEGGVRIDSRLGIKLNDIDRPLITRGWFPFTSGAYEGVGRFGLFMEPWTLTAGLPTHAATGFQIVSYNEDSTINTVLMSVNQSGVVTADTFNPTSDRAAKEHFEPVDPLMILEQVASLPITRWNFRRDLGTRHLGPVAQDFHAAFGLGTDDKHIATVDADGVALAAIQGLNQKLENQVRQKDAEIEELKRELGDLRQLVNSLISKRSGGGQ